MKRTDLVVGETYLQSSTRDPLEGGWSPRFVEVVEAENYARARHWTTKRLARTSALFVTRHLKWALTQAFPDDYTKNEARDALNRVDEAERHAIARALEMQPMLGFRKVVGRVSVYERGGILCRLTTNDGSPGTLVLVPTRELRMTRAEALVDIAERKQRANENRRAREEHAAILD